MTTHGTFSFDVQNDADCQRFDFVSYNGGSGQGTPNVISAAGTAAEFCHDTDGGNSANVGPDQGQGGVGDCYLYTECSSPGANGDDYYMTFDTVLDASAEQWQFNFYTIQRGPAIGNNHSTCTVQINEDGAGWVTITAGQFGGSGDDTTDGTAWVSRSVDLSESGANTNSNTQVRLWIETDGPTNAWHGDYGIDTVQIVGTPAAYKLEGVTKDNAGSVLGTCECFLCKDNGDNTASFIDYDQSDGSGNYSFTGIQDNDAAYFVISWKDNTPHVFDVTDHVLQPVEE